MRNRLNVVFTIHPETNEQLKEYAWKNRTSKSEVIRQAVVEYLEIHDIQTENPQGSSGDNGQ
jgi:predicted transcriptional regulator